MDFKAADWQISIRSIEWEGGICLLPWSLGRWGRLRSSSLSQRIWVLLLESDRDGAEAASFLHPTGSAGSTEPEL